MLGKKTDDKAMKGLDWAEHRLHCLDGGHSPGTEQPPPPQLQYLFQFGHSVKQNNLLYVMKCQLKILPSIYF